MGEALAGKSSWAAVHAAGCVDAGRMVAGCGLSGPTHPSLSTVTGLVTQLVSTEVQRAVHAYTASLPQVPAAGETTDRYVVSGRTGIGHVVKITGPGVPPERWETACGWKYGARPHATCMGTDVTCRRCVKFLCGTERSAQEGSADRDSVGPGAVERPKPHGSR